LRRSLSLLAHHSSWSESEDKEAKKDADHDQKKYNSEKKKKKKCSVVPEPPNFRGHRSKG